MIRTRLPSPPDPSPEAGEGSKRSGFRWVGVGLFNGGSSSMAVRLQWQFVFVTVCLRGGSSS